MKTSHLEFLAGGFVLLGLGAVAYLTIHLGSGALPAGATYDVEARFTNAGGLHAGSSVLIAGVPVGRVEAVRVDPADFSAVATLRLQRAIALPTDTMASVKTTGLIGDKFVALAPGADDTTLVPGDRITMTESAVDLESLIGKMAFGRAEADPDATPTPTPLP